MTRQGAAVHGTCAAGFERVQEVFESHFEDGLEVGSACAVYLQGEPVVDIWAGEANAETGAPWKCDTLQMVMSASKGAVALCVLMLVDRGLIDLDAPVADYWPEFASGGKADIPVRWALSHRAGVPAGRTDLTPEDVYSWFPVVEGLAASEPYWEPGSAHGYHMQGYGFLNGELVRRVSGRSYGRFFAEEVAAPLGLDAFVGVPPAEEHRVARLKGSDEVRAEGGTAEVYTKGLASRASLLYTGIDFNDPRMHAAELPSCGLYTTARSFARMYAATVGEVDGVRLLSPGMVDQARTIESDGYDRMMDMDTRFGLGFMVHTEGPWGPFLDAGSFGHRGGGGSLGWASPDLGVGFAYTTNKLDSDVPPRWRRLALNDALMTCLSEMRA